MCAGLPKVTPATNFSTNIQSGNTIECRLYHATVATDTPSPHCLHTAVTPTAPCS
jgi:hypothetical protein